MHGLPPGVLFLVPGINLSVDAIQQIKMAGTEHISKVELQHAVAAAPQFRPGDGVQIVLDGYQHHAGSIPDAFTVFGVVVDAGIVSNGRDIYAGGFARAGRGHHQDGLVADVE